MAHLVVSLKGDRTEQRNPGDYVGEIALLRGTVRTIDVAAGADGATVWALHRDVFLPAIGSEPRSLARATREAERRLSRFDGELPSQQS